MINYYLSIEKSELNFISVATANTVKYSSINNITKGSNLTYHIDQRTASGDENCMYEYVSGPMGIFYNGYLYGTKEDQCVYVKKAMYIPEDTEDTPEAYIAAAQKRINDYLGNNSVIVSYGGLLSSLPDDAKVNITSDDNYYNIKVGNRVCKFYIVKAPAEKLVAPTYIGTNIDTNIEITSEDSSIPLDTSVTASEVTNKDIENALGTSVYAAYDISLYSHAKKAHITKLENGKFKVGVPVPAKLRGQDITVYYITSTGETEEHVATVEKGFAYFETDHFSTYVLAAKNSEEDIADGEDKKDDRQKDNEPKAGVKNYIVFASIIASISMAGIIKLRKQRLIL